jgi:hypothetical protein
VQIETTAAQEMKPMEAPPPKHTDRHRPVAHAPVREPAPEEGAQPEPATPDDDDMPLPPNVRPEAP